MAVVAKMYVQSVTLSGGSVWVPLCQAHRLSESWPPPETHLSESGNYGHDPRDCEDCQQVALTDPDLFCTQPVRGGSLDLQPDDDGNLVGRQVRFGSVRLPGQSNEHVRLQAVKSGEIDDPNNAWALATPAGTLEMTIDNPDAWGFFDPSAEYFVEIRRAVPARGNRGRDQE